MYINPKITYFSSKKVVIYEGCGSVVNGNLFGPVERPSEITIEAYDEKNNKFQLSCNGILARVIQHEYDHLNGTEFLEKVTDYSKFMTFDFYAQKIRSSQKQKSASKITKIAYKKL